MAVSESNIAVFKTVVSAVGSVAATVVLIRSFTREYIPVELQDYLYSRIRSFLAKFSYQMTLVIHEFDGMTSNEIYEAAEVYLGTKINPETKRLSISKAKKEKHMGLRMARDEEIVDTFNGVTFKWTCRSEQQPRRDFPNITVVNSPMRSETRSFELTFHSKYKDMAINSYLPYITNEAIEKIHEKKTIKIFTLENIQGYQDVWNPMTLDHPATFETVAMDTDQKDLILKDLDRFLKRKEHYRKVGKAWKRGYLLYGPPGTGKSSLIAAIANYLNFDVYDLELTAIGSNSDLRRLLVATANRSILVVEDIDCSIDLQENLANRDIYSHGFPFQQNQTKVTLSGLLNFVDGLWSSCGDERIIIFTTNHIDKLDPALLRPGRLDVHINMSYCSPCGFKLLASNYFGIKEHPLYEEIEGLIRNVKATPAEVAEQFLKEDDPNAALEGLIELLHKKINDNEKADEVEKTNPAGTLVTCKDEMLEMACS